MRGNVKAEIDLLTNNTLVSSLQKNPNISNSTSILDLRGTDLTVQNRLCATLVKYSQLIYPNILFENAEFDDIMHQFYHAVRTSEDEESAEQGMRVYFLSS